MVINCCIVGCKSATHDNHGNKLENGLTFHRFPAWRRNQGDQVSEITRRRRIAWVAAVRRQNITFKSIPVSMRVCSLHFHSGKPSYEMYTSHPDWAPSLHLGHSEVKATNAARYERVESRKRRRTEGTPAIAETRDPDPQEMETHQTRQYFSSLQPSNFVDHCYARTEHTDCVICDWRKMNAAKSCLSTTNPQTPSEAPPSPTLQLQETSKKLQNTCPCHEDVMKIFCRTDQQWICYFGTIIQHKDHEKAYIAAERAEKQKELQVSRQQIQQRIQDQEKDVKLLQQEVEAINVSADKAVEDSEKIFTELIRLLQERSSDVKQKIRSQQETEVSRVKKLQEKLEQEITELKRKDSELEQLSNTEDHNQFLHNYPSLSALSDSTNSSSIKIRPLRYFEDVTAALSELRDKLQDILRDSWTNISLMVTEEDVLLTEPETRARVQQYSPEITLAPNTANVKSPINQQKRHIYDPVVS